MIFHVERSPLMPSATSIALRLSIGLLMLDSLIEIALAGNTTAWLSDTVRHKIFHFTAYGSRHHLYGLPLYLISNQIDTSSGAAITAFIVIGIWGFLSLWLRNLTQYRRGKFAKFSRYFYYLWVSFNVPALILTGAALTYVFTVTNARAGQRIDTALAVNLNGSPYYVNTWTPQSWFSAVLRLKLTRDREDIARHLNVMRGWQYNLIPMFLLQLAETVLAFLDYNRWIQKPKLPETCSRL
ncbi:hypothetical protein F5Y12DRAFT_715022 [Xylaria sp. FL1777]|nr:hypothetical protein F5Y12DRAFT_715022 [Xylaria sp. FL1777]